MDFATEVIKLATAALALVKAVIDLTTKAHGLRKKKDLK